MDFLRALPSICTEVFDWLPIGIFVFMTISLAAVFFIILRYRR